MPSLSVSVFKHGKPQPNASVGLAGPSGPKTMQTNGAGAVNFMDLAPGKYNVWATFLGESLGAGFYNLPPGGGGVIHIKYPQKPTDPATKSSSLTVSVFWTGSTTGQPKLANPAFITLTGPSPRNDMAGPEPLTFKNLKSGEYSISARSMAEGGSWVSGTGRKRVHAGTKNSIQIFLTAPGLPPEVCETGVGTPEEVKKKIQELDSEIARKKAELKLKEDFYEEHKRQIKERGPGASDPESGDDANKGGLVGGNIRREYEIKELKKEISQKEALLEGYKDALRKSPCNNGSFPTAAQEHKNKPPPTRHTDQI